jgi:hypothetical protein
VAPIWLAGDGDPACCCGVGFWGFLAIFCSVRLLACLDAGFHGEAWSRVACLVVRISTVIASFKVKYAPKIETATRFLA